MRKNTINKRSGFTLVELLVAAAIISILTILTVAQFQTAKRKANDVARKADLNGVSKSVQMYFTDYGYFPEEADIIWGGTFEDDSVNPPYVYMKKMPRENYTSIPYCYKVSADRKKFALFAQLENKVDKECDPDGDGIIRNYQCNGNSYCYGITSPNTSLSNTGALQ